MRSSATSSCRRTATSTTTSTRSRSPSARARPSWRSSSSPSEITGKGVEDVIDPNLGGTVTFDWGWVKLMPAWHTGTTPDGCVHTPAGLLISLGGKLVYVLGDTALFSDLALAKRAGKIDLAIVPIGGHYTMDRHDAVAAVDLVDPLQVIPSHYGTFPPIETDAGRSRPTSRRRRTRAASCSRWAARTSCSGCERRCRLRHHGNARPRTPATGARGAAERRRRAGVDRLDEVWEGVLHMPFRPRA